jgi:hypothetical protein
MIIIDDNFTSPAYANDIEAAILSDVSPIYWTLNKETNVEHPGEVFAIADDKTYSSWQMVSYVEAGHPMFRPIMNLFESFVRKHDIAVNGIMRIKINLVPRDFSPAGSYHMPHVDSDGPHKVFLYYVNNSDGNTFFFNEEYNGERPESFTARQTVSPLKGRGVVFDGKIYHSSSSPQESPFRCIINLDFV